MASCERGDACGERELLGRGLLLDHFVAFVDNVLVVKIGVVILWSTRIDHNKECCQWEAILLLGQRHN